MRTPRIGRVWDVRPIEFYSDRHVHQATDRATFSTTPLPAPRLTRSQTCLYISLTQLNQPLSIPTIDRLEDNGRCVDQGEPQQRGVGCRLDQCKLERKMNRVCIRRLFIQDHRPSLGIWVISMTLQPARSPSSGTCSSFVTRNSIFGFKSSSPSVLPYQL